MKRPLALYLMARALQCGYNSIKIKGYWNFPGSNWFLFLKIFLFLKLKRFFF